MDDGDTFNLSDNWQNIAAVCSKDPIITNTDAATLLLRVAMTPDLTVCTPAANADSTCLNFDSSRITPVNGKTYDLCGPPGNCVVGEILMEAAEAIQFKCTNNANMTGGSVEITPGVTVQL